MGEPTDTARFSSREILEIAWRRKWAVLVPFALIGSAAAFVAHALPSVYQASTVILVEKPKVPETYVKSTVTTRIEDRLATINQQVLSRTWLERLINDLDLFRAERPTVPMEVLVARLRRDIDVRVEGRRKERNAFSISYRGYDPRLVRDVANKLASLFIEENSKVREEQAAGTSEFLDTQLAALKETLAQQERKVREFKERYLGELPQQQEANLRAIDRLQAQSRALTDQLQATEDRRLLLQTQLASTPRFVSSAVPSSRGAAAPVRPAAAPTQDPAVKRLEQARSALTELQGRYTELHPDVVRAKRQVEELESLVDRTRLPSAGATAGSGAAPGPVAAAGEGTSFRSPRPADEAGQVPNPFYQQIEAQLAGVENDIARYRKGQDDIAAEVRMRQRRVENVPRLEQQLLELTRDYDNTRATYASLLAKKLDAQVAESLEKRQKGEQFRVLDPAKLPRRPYKPNRDAIGMFGLVLGLGVGAAGAIGLELLDHSIRRPRELKALAPRLALLGTVPVIADPVRTLRRRLVQVAAGLLALMMGTAVAVGAMQHKDEIARFKSKVGQLSVFEFLLR